MKRRSDSDPAIGSIKRVNSCVSSVAFIAGLMDGDVTLRKSEPCITDLQATAEDAVCHLQQVSVATDESASSTDNFFVEDSEEDIAIDLGPIKRIMISSRTEASASVNLGDYKTGVVFADSSLHIDLRNRFHPERPLRVTTIHDTLVEAGIHERCTLFELEQELPSRSSESAFLNNDDFLRVHLPGYLQRLEKLSGCTCQDALDADAQQFQSVFLTSDSVRLAKNAAASLCRLVSKVVDGDLDNGFAVIRPPGHHAEPGMAGGYCIVNNVAVAAAYARDYLGVGKVLIVDWDVHHGNGTQAAFLKDPNVMYISVHRWQGGNFYPYQSSGGPTAVGVDQGLGFNVNVGWNRKGMGDNEYYATWNKIVMPLAYEYKPDLILVSAGFDAATGDMGECHVTPECFGNLTQSLMTLTNGKLVCSLEGGYVRSVLGQCVLRVVEALLNRCHDHQEEHIGLDDIDASAAASIRATMASQRSFWQCIQEDSRFLATD